MPTRFLTTTAVLLALIGGHAAPVAAEPAPKSFALAPFTLPQSATFEVKGRDGEAYEIMVAWPEGQPPAAGWPVLSLLDGEDNFAVAAVTARRLARARGRTGIEPGIVVGLAAGPLKRRVRDYTPPSPGYAIPAGQPASGLQTGGADAFLDLIERSILPAVRSRWPVDTSRETLAGHSFGGLLALHALLTRPQLFDSAVAISPSLWFGDRLIDAEIEKASGVSVPRRLLLAEGDEPSPVGSASNLAQDTVHRLQAKSPTLKARFLPLPGQSHGTTFLAAIVPAIGFAFGKVER